MNDNAYYSCKNKIGRKNKTLNEEVTEIFELKKTIRNKLTFETFFLDEIKKISKGEEEEKIISKREISIKSYFIKIY